jgi:hypothetical protein
MSEPLPVRLVEFRAKRHGTFRGWATVELPYGMIIPDCPVHVHGRRAVAYPPVRLSLNAAGHVVRAQSGKACERSMIEFASPEHKEAFVSAIASSVASAHPEILDRRA